MAQRRHHYERAFEAFLRARRIPYVAVDEARKSLVPSAALGGVGGRLGVQAATGAAALKSFDFVIYGAASGAGDGGNLLVDIKGRRVAARKPRPARLSIGQTDLSFSHSPPPPFSSSGPDAALQTGRLESWVTREDIDSLTEWERLFGPGFRAAFVFVYACEAQPPDALFQEVFEHGGVWYAIRVALVSDYVRHMKVRSPKWGTLDIPRRIFERISQPLVGSGVAGSQGPELAALEELGGSV